MDGKSTEQVVDQKVDHVVTQTAQQEGGLMSQEGIQGTFYQNILDGGIRPTLIAIFIISLGNILETGTFFGFLVPGDVLLFSSGVILGTNQRRLSALFLVIFCILSTVAGDLLGYWWAGKLGDKLYDRKDTWFFKKKYLYLAQAYFEKYSERALYIGRFIIVGSFLPMLAGVAKMNIIRFTIHAFVSATIWTLATFLPSFLIGLIWPGIISSAGWLLVLGYIIFTVTEGIAWVVLFNSDIKQIMTRIRASHEQFASIKTHMSAIKSQVGTIASYVVKGDDKNLIDNNAILNKEKEETTNPISSSTQ